MQYTSLKLFGHSYNWDNITKLYAGHKLAHCLLFLGEKGIGKKTFAQHLASYIINNLSATNDEQQANTRYINHYDKVLFTGNHPDCRIASNNISGNEQRHISINDINVIVNFFTKTSLQNNCRVAIIDSIDNVNKLGANCLLKTLEEPPQKSLFILICHNIETVPQTIISRCQIYKFNNLPLLELDALLTSNNIDTTDLQELAQHMPLTPGLYTGITRLGGMQFYQDFITVFKQTSNNNFSNIFTFGDKYIFNNIQDYPLDLMWQYFCDFFQTWLYGFIIEQVNNKQKIFHDSHFCNSQSFTKVVQCWFKIAALIKDVCTFNLEKRQVFALMFNQDYR